MNELIFICHSIITTLFSLCALALGSHALIAFICIQCILSNLFITKQIILFGFTATCTDAFTIGATLSLNLLQEYFGKAIAKKTIWINFLLLIFYTLVSQIHLAYIPITNTTIQQHFMAILAIMPRITIASLFSYLITQILDYCLYGALKKFFMNKYLLFRNYTSIIICQFIDTLLFSILGLWGIVDNIYSIIFVSYSIKLASIIIATPLILLSKSIYKTQFTIHPKQNI